MSPSVTAASTQDHNALSRVTGCDAPAWPPPWLAPLKPPPTPLKPATIDLAPSLEGIRWGPGLDDATPGIVIPADWRSEVASWPHARWVAWRRRSAELQGPGASAEGIRLAERAAYDELVAPTKPVADDPAIEAEWLRFEAEVAELMRAEGITELEAGERLYRNYPLPPLPTP